MSKIKLLAMLPLLTLSIVQAQQPKTLSEALEAVRLEYGLPALAVGIIKDGRISQTAAVGKLTLSRDTPVSPESQYQLGSVSKGFAALVIARLVEQGKLSWDSKLGDILPDLPMLPAYRTVTVENLLGHMAGLPREGKYWASSSTEYVMAALAVPRQPGKFSYSNVGYALLSLIAEKITNDTWSNLLQKEVFTPLQLNGCSYGLARDDGKKPWPHLMKGNEVQPQAVDASGSGTFKGGATMVRCDLQSFGKYAISQLSEGKENSGYLSKDTWKKLHTDTFNSNYGAGWFITIPKGKTYTELSHTGSDGMNMAVVRLWPQYGAGTYIFTNVGYSDQAGLDRLNIAIEEARSALQPFLNKR